MSGKYTQEQKEQSEESTKSEKREVVNIMQGVVKLPAKGFMGSARARNLILTNEPRLYMTTTMATDKIEGAYKKDILLFV
jgi:hypothetical protein